MCPATRVVWISSALPNSISVAAQIEHFVGRAKIPDPITREYLAKDGEPDFWAQSFNATALATKSTYILAN